METLEVTFVRLYITESSRQLKSIIHYLKQEAGTRGVSVFRAISGYGDSGEHRASWIDLSLDLPFTSESALLKKG